VADRPCQIAEGDEGDVAKAEAMLIGEADITRGAEGDTAPWMRLTLTSRYIMVKNRSLRFLHPLLARSLFHQGLQY
jgi:hypothetical protein